MSSVSTTSAISNLVSNIRYRSHRANQQCSSIFTLLFVCSHVYYPRRRLQRCRWRCFSWSQNPPYCRPGLCTLLFPPFNHSLVSISEHVLETPYGSYGSIYCSRNSCWLEIRSLRFHKIGPEELLPIQCK